jgi:TPR repeat protein
MNLIRYRPGRSAILAFCILTSIANAGPLEDAIAAIEVGPNSSAVEVLKKHATDGDNLAQFHLGRIYFHGHGAQEDELQALEWWKKSAAQGNTEAMYQIGHAYLFGNTLPRSITDPDREGAIWYFRSASAGHAESAYQLGLLFLAGTGVVKSQTEAMRWFRTAAKKGHAEAQKALESAERSQRQSTPPAKPKTK